MTVTSDQILKLRAKLVLDEPGLSPSKVVQGVRTLVHGLLQLESPPPHSLRLPDTGKTRADYEAAYQAATSDEDRQRIHDAEMTHFIERKAEMMATVPMATHIAYQRVRTSIPHVKDAHHYAQYLHGIELWKQTDALVALAGVK